MHLPGKITYKEIDEMIATVDKNEDWKISYSEFRVISCHLKLLTIHLSNVQGVPKNTRSFQKRKAKNIWNFPYVGLVWGWESQGKQDKKT